jgi:hypothetical protein
VWLFSVTRAREAQLVEFSWGANKKRLMVALLEKKNCQPKKKTAKHKKNLGGKKTYGTRQIPPVGDGGTIAGGV